MVTLLSNRWVARPSATVSPPVITTASLPNATRGSAYSTSLAATGGVGPYTWSMLSNTPNTGSWLSLSSAGVLSGTPSTVEVESIAVLLRDAVGNTAAATFLLTVVSSGVTFAPNRPAGLSTILDRQWNPTDPTIPGGVLPPASLSGTDSYHCAWFGGFPPVAPYIDTPANLTTRIGRTIPALPDGNATCMAIFYPSGFNQAQTPFVVSYTGAFSTMQRMYHCCWVNMPSNFRSNGNNIKWFGFQNVTGKSNHIAMMSSQDNTTDGRSVWMVTQGVQNGVYGGEGGNSPGAITSLPVSPPLGSGPGVWASNYDNWHCLEWFMQTESNPGVSADGVFKGWFDGTLINYWNNITYNAPSGDSNGFNFIQLEPLYGGGGSAAPGNEYFCVGRFLVAGA